MTAYLTPVRRSIELLMVAYGTGFGLFVWVHAQRGAHALAWSGIDLATGLAVAQTMALAGLVHGLGVRINGHWRWSPFLRLAGAAAHAVALASLARLGLSAESTAAYTYGFIVTLFAGVVWFVAQDCASAIRRAPAWSRR